MLDRYQILLAAAILALSFSGCTTSPYFTANWDEVEMALQPGMTPEAVEGMLGEPPQVDEPDLSTAAGGIVTWIYSRRVPSGTTMAATGVIEVPWFDPITGELKSEKQPSYSMVELATVEEFHLHWRNGTLYDWQRFVRQELDFR